jgi:hypothetical protein
MDHCLKFTTNEICLGMIQLPSGMFVSSHVNGIMNVIDLNRLEVVETHNDFDYIGFNDILVFGVACDEKGEIRILNSFQKLKT